jgi:cysteine-rich repeat protein
VVNNNDAEACEPPGTEVCTDACTIRTAQCGDGLLTPPEQCEDGNLASGDGCNSGCALEFCGDGVINNNGTEECEPPDTALCTNGCAAREALCGDGFKTPPEQCEDGNLANGDGCTSSCTLEFCGDGVVNNDGVEACEPPGTALCTTTCTIRFPLCGDGLLTSPEECEDGNLANGDGCTSSCVLEFCGDGVINNNDAEACEPPGASACTDACTIRTPLCGDGFVTPPEECEDGNLTDGDGCSSACASEAAPFCGDGVMDDGEECDDGNVEDGDGCSAMCELEPSPTPDGGTPDGGMPDGGIPDGGMPDGGIPDGGGPDGGMDDSGSGSGCSVQKGGAPMNLPVLLSVFALVIARRRRSTAR